MRRLPIGPPERGQRGKGAHRVLAGRNPPTRVTGQSKCVPPKMKEYYSTGGIADSLRSFRWKGYWACLKDLAPSGAPALAPYSSNPHQTVPRATPEPHRDR